jgi:hypothetical protein
MVFHRILDFKAKLGFYPASIVLIPAGIGEIYGLPKPRLPKPAS